MSDAPTPETDAFYSTGGYRTDGDSKEFACRLERERNEAFSQMSEIGIASCDLKAELIMLRARVAELEGAACRNVIEIAQESLAKKEANHG